MSTDKLSKYDKKYEKTIKLLKELPNISAPDDFEFKLMTKIKNQDFASDRKMGASRLISWKLAPAAALVLTAVILFFVIDKNLLENENTFVNDPPQKLKSTDLKPDTVEFEEVTIESPEPVTSAGSLEEKSSSEISDENKVLKREQFRVVLQPNDAVSREKIDLPFDKDSGVELDNFIGHSNTPRTVDDHTKLIKKGNGNDLPFDGFYLRMRENEQIMMDLRSQMDSMWKLQNERDSLRKLDTARAVK